MKNQTILEIEIIILKTEVAMKEIIITLTKTEEMDIHQTMTEIMGIDKIMTELMEIELIVLIKIINLVEQDH